MDLYEKLPEAEVEQRNPEDDQQRLTLSVDNLPLAEFARLLALESDISIVISERLDNARVTLDVTDQPVATVLSMVSRRLGVQLNRSGQLYFLGELRPEDLGLLVKRVYRLTADEIKNAVSIILSEFGDVVSFNDGLLVVADRVEVLTRIETLISELSQAESVTWVLQLYLFELTSTDLQDLGVDAVPALDLAFRIGMASTAPAGFLGQVNDLSNLNASFNVLLRAVRNAGNSHLQAEPMILLTDGNESLTRRGQTIPVPRRSVSDQGTVTTSGFDFVNTGQTFRVLLREVSPTLARLTVNVQLAQLDGFVESAPITSEQSFDTQADIQTGGVYLLASLRQRGYSESVDQALKLGRRKEADLSVLQLWCRAYKITGAIRTHGHARGAPGSGAGVPVREVVPSPLIGESELLQPPVLVIPSPPEQPSGEGRAGE